MWLVMASCHTCGFEKGEGRYCPKCGAMDGAMRSPESPAQVATYSTPMGQPASTFGYQPNNAFSATTGTSHPGSSSSGATAFGVSLLIASAVGIISTFLPWLSGNGDSANGWKVREAMVEAELFSAGAILVIMGSVATLIMASVLLSTNGKGNATNRIGLGIGLLISGLLMAGGVGATYNDLSDYFTQDAVSEILAAGWYLGALIGFATAAAGIVAMLAKPLTNSR